MIPISGKDMGNPPVAANQTLEGLNENQPSTGVMGDLENREAGGSIEQQIQTDNTRACTGTMADKPHTYMGYGDDDKIHDREMMKDSHVSLAERGTKRIFETLPSDNVDLQNSILNDISSMNKFNETSNFSNHTCSKRETSVNKQPNTSNLNVHEFIDEAVDNVSIASKPTSLLQKTLSPSIWRGRSRITIPETSVDGHIEQANIISSLEKHEVHDSERRIDSSQPGARNCLL